MTHRIVVQIIPMAGMTTPTTTGTSQWAFRDSGVEAVVELKLVAATDVLYGYHVAMGFV
jgi:hypothetical protein